MMGNHGGEELPHPVLLNDESGSTLRDARREKPHVGCFAGLSPDALLKSG
jgi:hypothetical protein